MATRQTKKAKAKEERLEGILWSCRNRLRGKADMSDKLLGDPRRKGYAWGRRPHAEPQRRGGEWGARGTPHAEAQRGRT